ncbi:SDR family NAD(P)-dependent oxidoreductase [Candidatus Pelagibacter sp.]|uniref:SDR family NAD(P)-dependent oxidoreductase n=1 Tax=Candidatus Pelagibacter sp. TaxID=2024849 RepID=UPI003F865704
MLLKDKVAVVSGASGDIGKKILEKFSNEGSNIYALVRNIEDKEFIEFTENLKKKNNNKISIIHLDLEKEETIKSSFDLIKKDNTSIDILVNNAGTVTNSLFQMTSLKSLRNIFEINFFSQFLLTQIYLKLLNKSKKGSIVFVSSNSANENPVGRSAYSASKAALNSLTKTISKEMGVKNLRVNAVLPGLTDTKMAKNFTKDDAIDEYLNKVALKRIAKTSEIANVIAFLASDKSSYINGQLITIDGGR